MKKTITIAVLMALVTGGFAQTPTFDFSAVCESGQTLYYQISDISNFEIAIIAPDLSSGYPAWITHNKPTGDLIIPDSVEYEGNTYTVVSLLERAFMYCTELTSVVVPNSVTLIGERAFSYDSELVSAILPSRLTVIEGLTFTSCHSLVSVTLPDSLTTIKGKAFQSCESLPSITFPNTLLSIATDAFWGCTSLSGELVLPTSLQNIGSSCFYGCSGLSGVLTLPESLIGLGEGCFSQCSGLTGLIIPNHCTSIGYEAFANCSNLSSLTIGSSVLTIGCGAFMDCTALETIHCNTPALPYSAPPQSDPDEFGNYPVFYHVPTDIPVYVSCFAVNQFQTSVHWSHFTNMQGVFIGAPLLTVEVNDPEFGTAVVVSIPEDCDHPTATVRAIPNLGHVFGYWKRNGAIMSFSPEYTFTLDHDCVMTAYFDCSATINDSIGYPDHVIGRKYNAANQVTAEYDSDFSYDENGILKRFYFPNPTNSLNSYINFFEFPSKPSNIRMYYSTVYDDDVTTETLNYTYEADHQIKHCDHYRGNNWYDEINNHYDYYYNSHRLFLKDFSFTEDGVTHISSRNKYSYENGNRIRIDSAYSGTTRLSSVTTNHYNERQQLLSSQTDNFDNNGTITSRSLKTYTYTNRNKTDSIITQTFSEGNWINSGITHYVYDDKYRVIEYQTGSWSAESSEWNITKKVLYDFNDETQIVTISFRKKNNDEWVWDVFSGQSLFNDSQLNEWQRQLKSSYTSYHVNQFEISMHYNTVEQNFPILSEWYYKLEWDNGDITYQHLEYVSDTTIGSSRPKIIVRSNTQYDKDAHIEVTHEYILEEGNKVYWWNKDLEEYTTLYDYNAEAGDEWEIKVGTESITVHVDSVGVFEYDGETHRVLHISDIGNIFNGDIVVGYGHMTSFFPEKLMHRDGGYTVNGLRCYWVGDALLYHNGDEDCDAVYSEIHGVEEEGPSTPSTSSGTKRTLVVYPNPANNMLFVETQNFASLPDPTYRITNLAGQTLMTGILNVRLPQCDSPTTIDISSLPAGMYFINVGGQTVKFVKQ